MERQAKASSGIAIPILAVLLFWPFVGMGQESASSSPPGSRSSGPETGGDKPVAKVLHFPADRSLGRVLVRDPSVPFPGGQLDWTGSEWEFLATARGEVTVPAGRLVGLFTSEEGRKDLSPLAKLRPDDLDSVVIWQESRDVANWTCDGVMRHLAHLTGLRCLIVSQRYFTQRDLEYAKKLKSLEWLELADEKVPRGGLAVLRGFQSLTALSYGPRISESELQDIGDLPNLRELYLSFRELHGDSLRNLERLPKLTHLHLWADSYRPGALRSLRSIPTLRVLDLNAKRPLGDADLEELSHVTQLEEINFPKMDNSDAGWDYLASLRSLKKLNVKDAYVTDAGLSHLKKVRSLESLILSGNLITDEGVAQFGELRNLKNLRLYGRMDRPISDVGLSRLESLKSLEGLLIAGKGIGDRGMESISKLTKLRNLWIHGAGITDSGIGKLKTLHSLEILNLDGPGTMEKGKGFTIAGLSQLNALPNLRELTSDDIRPSSVPLDLSGLRNLKRLALGMCRGETFRDSDLQCIARLSKLRILNLYPQAGIDDAGMAHLAGLTGLTSLGIGGKGFTDKGLAVLKSMTKLTNVYLGGSFTEAGLEALHGHGALRSVTLRSSMPLSAQAVDQLRASLPNVYVFNVRGSHRKSGGK